MTEATPIKTPCVEAGSFLTLHYRLSGPAGEIINTFDGKPATLMLGLPEGTQRTFEIPPGEAFGPRNPEMVQWVARKLLDEFGDPQESYHVGDVVKFPAPDGKASYAGAVQQLRDDADGQAVQFDFNHPLAGQPLQFEVQLIGVL